MLYIVKPLLLSSAGQNILSPIPFPLLQPQAFATEEFWGKGTKLTDLFACSVPASPAGAGVDCQQLWVAPFVFLAIYRSTGDVFVHQPVMIHGYPSGKSH